MWRFVQRAVRWWAGPGPIGPAGRLISRWLFMRALGVIYFSAFYSLLFQIRGLLGPNGLLPAGSYLQEVAKAMPGLTHFWYAPTLLWLTSSNRALMVLCWIGLIASVMLVLNLWPRFASAIGFLLFLSFVAAAEDFSGYQSDGMLLAAGFICLLLAPGGLRPGLGEKDPPSRAAVFVLMFLWFSIYFESGIAKYFGGDPSWRDFSAMNEYYQNGPLPTWIGWYAAQLPRAVHEATALVTVFTELVVVGMALLPRPFRIACFFLVTLLQAGIILTANYAFLNYLVLALGIFLLDDGFLLRLVPGRRRLSLRARLAFEGTGTSRSKSWFPFRRTAEDVGEAPGSDLSLLNPPPAVHEGTKTAEQAGRDRKGLAARAVRALWLWTRTFLLAWVLYATAGLLLEHVSPGIPLPRQP